MYLCCGHVGLGHTEALPLEEALVKSPMASEHKKWAFTAQRPHRENRLLTLCFLSYKSFPNYLPEESPQESWCLGGTLLTGWLSMSRGQACWVIHSTQVS